MSNSQQEIATPKACKIIICFALTAITAVFASAVFMVLAHVQAAVIAAALCMTAVAVTLLVLSGGCVNAIISGSAAVINVLFTYLSAEYGLLNGVYTASIGIAVSLAGFIAALALKRDYVSTAINTDIFCVAVSVSLFAFFRYSAHGGNKILWIAVVAALFIALINCCAYILGSNKNAVTAKYICYTATFAALSVLCKTMGNAISFIPFLKFTIVYIPWLLSGTVLGPIGAVVTAVTGDFLGQLIVQNGGLPLPLLLISNALFALFPALTYKYFRFIKSAALRLLVGLCVSIVVCTLGLSTLAIAQITVSESTFAETFFTLMVSRLPQVAVIAMNYGLTVALLPITKRISLLKPIPAKA